GMYSVATYKMLGAIDLDGLDWLPVLALVGALVAWTVTFVGLVHHLVTRRTLSADAARIP
ncbi:MAG: hypothetical protein WBP59_12045, partial [Ilumatobacteraceae bacterium]